MCVCVSVCLAERQLFEVHRQERQLELCERRQLYQWSTSTTTGCVTRGLNDEVPLPRLIQVTLAPHPSLDCNGEKQHRNSPRLGFPSVITCLARPAVAIIDLPTRCGGKTQPWAWPTGEIESDDAGKTQTWGNPDVGNSCVSSLHYNLLSSLVSVNCRQQTLSPVPHSDELNQTP